MDTFEEDNSSSGEMLEKQQLNFQTTILPAIVNNLLTFSWIDYTLFCLMFAISAFIGLYFGCFGSKQKNTKDYLLGGKTMGVFPIAMSLIASNISGISLLGIPAEIYVYGTQYWACVICSFAIVISMYFIYLPVFHKLQLNSSYEYLSLRFDTKIRKMASIIFIINTFLYIPIVIYIPALAFNQVSGIDLHVITPIVCLICIFYTTLGGLKAVVWTDTFQFSITLLSMTVVFFMDTANIGGIDKIWQKSKESGRIEFFNMDLDPTTRCTFWGVAIGMSTMWIAHGGIHQACVQRYLSLPSLKDAKTSLIIFGLGVIITKCMSCFSGLIMYYKYQDCDPISSGKVNRMDQILPYYVLDVAHHLPGLSGVFISGVFSTALSTMSTSLNTLAGTIYEDFILPWKRLNFDEKNGHIFMKIMVVVVGVICVAMVYLVEHLGGVVQISMSFSGITGGPLLGLFTLGMIFPSSNTMGALIGSVTSFIFVSWMCFGQQYYHLKGKLHNVPKPLSTEGCTDLFNSTMKFLTSTTTPIPDFDDKEELPFVMYRISFYWYAFLGLLITIIVGLIASKLCQEDNQKTIYKEYLSPVIYKFLPENYPSSIPMSTDKNDFQTKIKLIENNLVLYNQ